MLYERSCSAKGAAHPSINFNGHSTISGNRNCIGSLLSLFLGPYITGFSYSLFSWFSFNTIARIRCQVSMLVFFIILSVFMVLNLSLILWKLRDRTMLSLIVIQILLAVKKGWKPVDKGRGVQKLTAKFR